MTRLPTFEQKINLAISLLLLACLVLPAVWQSEIGAVPVDRGLVYCPLQKAWVESAPAAQTRINVFDQICAAHEVEAKIFENVFARLSAFQIVAGADAAENLIFDYLRHGDSAVKLYRSSPPSSPAQSAELIVVKAVPGASQNPLHELSVTAAVCPQLCARPPTRSPQTFIFDDSGFCNRSAACTPNLLPRPPPVFS